MTGIHRLVFAAAVLLAASAPSWAQTPSKQEKERMASNIEAYLSTQYPSAIKHVEVTEDKVIVKGVCGGSGTYVLADITPWQDIAELADFPYVAAIDGRKFSLTLDRKVEGREGIDYDRVFSKWAVVKVEDGRQILDSHARYADEVAPKATPAPVPLKNKKGFGSGGNDLYFEEVKEIGVGSVTMNVWLTRVFDGSEGDDFSFGGRSFAIKDEGRKHLDRYLSKAAETGTVVSAIILCDNNSVFKDPENAGGFYTMPNMTTAEAFNVYAASLEYLASRYCSEAHGRISHWILHNEVDMGHEWTNMGDQPEMRFFDRYMKSMRICYNIVRQYDQNASILESFTHNWNGGDPGGYQPRRLLEKTLQYSEIEGDFFWGVGYHPYPQDLSKPMFWVDDTKAEWSRDTEYITFKNLEVVNDWILQKKHFFRGRKRPLFLSEQGTNSPSYSDEDLALQAAGAAWAWKKASALKGIDAIQWHNWTDDRGEFGLRIGLHTFEEGKYGNCDRKPAWYVWAAGGTEREDEVCNRYLDILGISSWKEIMHKVRK